MSINSFVPARSSLSAASLYASTTPFWNHPSLKPLLSVEEDNEADDHVMTSGDGDDDMVHDTGPRRLNAAGIELDDSEVESDDDDRLVDTSSGLL